jgi:hypothetical protein
MSKNVEIDAEDLMNWFELQLFKLEKEILKSKKWKNMIKTVDIGVKKPKNIEPLPVCLSSVMIRDIYSLVNSEDGDKPAMHFAFIDGKYISFDFQAFWFSTVAARKFMLTHELVHLFLENNNAYKGIALVGHFEVDFDEKVHNGHFEKCMKALGYNGASVRMKADLIRKKKKRKF